MTWRFEIYETLASTSDLCRERAEAGEKEKLAVLAKRQSAARGSRGRRWESGEGNLAFSFLCHFVDPQNFRIILPYLVGLALYDGVIDSCGQSAEVKAALCLKWPNDLLLLGRKMAGILIETGSVTSSCENEIDPPLYWAVIGMGVNLRQAPHIEERELAALSEIITPPEPELCARSILHAFDAWWQIWQKEGNEAIWQGWSERAHPLGTRLIVQRHDKDIKGRFAGLDMHGHLLLTLDDGTVTSVVTGDIICE